MGVEQEEERQEDGEEKELGGPGEASGGCSFRMIPRATGTHPMLSSRDSKRVPSSSSMPTTALRLAGTSWYVWGQTANASHRVAVAEGADAFVVILLVEEQRHIANGEEAEAATASTRTASPNGAGRWTPALPGELLRKTASGLPSLGLGSLGAAHEAGKVYRGDRSARKGKHILARRLFTGR